MLLRAYPSSYFQVGDQDKERHVAPPSDQNPSRARTHCAEAVGGLLGRFHQNHTQIRQTPNLGPLISATLKVNVKKKKV